MPMAPDVLLSVVPSGLTKPKVEEVAAGPWGPALVQVLLSANVTVLPKIIAPVEILPIEMLPVPLALIVRFSFAPLDNTEIAKPPAAAALLILNPVAAEAVEASTLNVGFVTPAGPTAKALAEFEVIT